MTRTRSKQSTIIAGSLVLMLMASGCADSHRPPIEVWEPDWSEATAALPTLAELGSPPSAEVCGDSLGSLRVARGGLIPTPDLALDGAVQAWFDVAQDAMFECPPSNVELPTMTAAYSELAKLEAEVDAALADKDWTRSR